MRGFVLAGTRKQIRPRVNQDELAAALGCDEETLKNVERGGWPDITQESLDKALAEVERISKMKARREVIAA